MSPQSSFQYAKQHKPCKPLVSRFFQPSYYFCGCFWHLPQFFNFLLKTWASEQYSVFQRWARQLRRCLISRTVSSVSVSEEGAGGRREEESLAASCASPRTLFFGIRTPSPATASSLSQSTSVCTGCLPEAPEVLIWDPPGLLFGLPGASAGCMLASR